MKWQFFSLLLLNIRFNSKVLKTSKFKSYICIIIFVSKVQIPTDWLTCKVFCPNQHQHAANDVESQRDTAEDTRPCKWTERIGRIWVNGCSCKHIFTSWFIVDWSGLFLRVVELNRNNFHSSSKQELKTKSRSLKGSADFNRVKVGAGPAWFQVMVLIWGQNGNIGKRFSKKWAHIGGEMFHESTKCFSVG